VSDTKKGSAFLCERRAFLREATALVSSVKRESRIVHTRNKRISRVGTPLVAAPPPELETFPLSCKPSCKIASCFFASNAHVRLSGCASEASQLLVRVRGVLSGDGTGGTDAAEKEDDGDKNETNDDQLACSRATGTVVGPSALCGAQVFLDLFSSKLVVDEATERNAVSEELERRDGVAEDHHGCNDEKDVL